MAAKRLIGVNLHYQPSANDGGCGYVYLCEGYFERIEQAGGAPVLLPPVRDIETLETTLNALDGVVLCGGPDLDPRNDGYAVHPSMLLMHPKREKFDRRLIELLARRRMPTLAIGSGMQLLNVVLGGTLFYDISEDLPRALPHLDPSGQNHRHALEVEPNSLMERVYGDGEIRVNSMHHMAIDEVAPGFAATARCPDGVIEAIESTMSDWFAIGTQFHPESPTSSALDLRVFEEFVAGTAGKVVELRIAQ